MSIQFSGRESSYRSRSKREVQDEYREALLDFLVEEEKAWDDKFT